MCRICRCLHTGIWIVLVFALCLACGGRGEAAEEGRPRRLLKTSLSLERIGDARRVLLRVDREGFLEFTLLGGGECRFRLELFDSSGRKIFCSASCLSRSPDGECRTILECPVVKSDTYTARVELTRCERAVTPGRGVKVDLAVVLHPLGQEEEPNDEFEHALPLECGKALEAAILPGTDVDCYALHVREPGLLKLMLKWRASGAALDVALFVRGEDGRPRLLWRKRTVTGGWFTRLESLVRPDTYYIRVSASVPDACTMEPYEMFVDFRGRSTDENEPNDSFDTATLLLTGEVREGYLLDLADVDCFRLFAPEEGLLAIQLEVPEGMRLFLECSCCTSRRRGGRRKAVRKRMEVVGGRKHFLLVHSRPKQWWWITFKPTACCDEPYRFSYSFISIR